MPVNISTNGTGHICRTCNKEIPEGEALGIFDGKSGDLLYHIHFNSTCSGNKSTFAHWIRTLVEEKGWEWDDTFEVVGKSGSLNIIELDSLVTAMIFAPRHEQEAIKNTVVKIDFYNGDILDYFKHLCQAIAI